MENIVTENLRYRGIDLNYKVAGDGPALLLLHGANGSMSFSPIVEDLSKHFRVILPDHPGFGDTKQAKWISTIPDLAYFYLDIIQAMNLDNVNLVGHSMGGWIATEIALRDSHNINSLTLISSAGLSVKGTPMGDLFSWSPEEAASQVFARKEFIDEMLEKVPNEDEISLMASNREMAKLLCKEAQFENPEIKKWGHRLDKPALILWGDSDGIFPEPFAHAFHNMISNSKLEIYKDCGHVPMLEARERFLQRLTDFIQMLT